MFDKGRVFSGLSWQANAAEKRLHRAIDKGCSLRTKEGVLLHSIALAGVSAAFVLVRL